MTYYAITKSTSPITITFNKNGNTSQTPSGGSASSENTITQSCYRYNGSSTCLITSPSFVSPSATPTHIGYSGASDSYTDSWTEDTSVGVSTDATYYAQSTAVALTYSVTYNNNGATSGIASNTSCNIAATYNGNIQPTTCSITTAEPPTKTYNKFMGWKSSTDNNVYNALATYNVTANTTLTAQWQEVWAENLSYDNTNGPSGCMGYNANAQCALDAITDILYPKVATTMTLSSSSGSVTRGNTQTVTITTDSDGALSCTMDKYSGFSGYCWINDKTLEIHTDNFASGYATVTVSQAASSTHLAATDVTYDITIEPSWSSSKSVYSSASDCSSNCINMCQDNYNSTTWSCENSTIPLVGGSGTGTQCWCYY